MAARAMRVPAIRASSAGARMPGRPKQAPAHDGSGRVNATAPGISHCGYRPEHEFAAEKRVLTHEDDNRPTSQANRYVVHKIQYIHMLNAPQTGNNVIPLQQARQFGKTVNRTQTHTLSA